jgi:hypothetical protein
MARRVIRTLLAFGGAVFLSSAAYAQSAIVGVVKDTSGAAMPGVTVEASSEVLIEKVKSAVTDGDGSYRITDLRPGTYVVTFTLTGFKTFKRDGLVLPSEFTATLNVELGVGALEETITVSGASPVVDVSSTTTARVLDREVLDAIPTGRTIQGMGQLITGVSLNAPDVGGSRAMQQTYMSGHGAGASQVTVQVDGLMVNGIDVDGAVQNYFNSSMSEEMVYTTSGANADVAGGGVRLNMIPKDGGNQIKGSFFAAVQDKGLTADNLSDDLKARGLRSTDGIDKLSNFEASLGGPIKKDKVWFFASARTFHLDTLPADVFKGIPGSGTPFSAPKPGTEAGVDKQNINSAQVRFTWQMSTTTKLAVYNDRLGKNRGAAMTAGLDPDTASIVWNSPIYTTGSVKLTSTGVVQIPHRGGGLHELRALQHSLPARHREGAVQRRVVYHRQQARHRTWHILECGRYAAGHVSRSFRRLIFGLVRHRRAQREGGRTGRLGSLRAVPQLQWRLARQLQQRRAVPGGDSQHAGTLSRQPERRFRDLRSGLVGARSVDAELWPALGVLRVGHSGGGRRRGPLRVGAHHRSDQDADLDERVAARRRRV